MIRPRRKRRARTYGQHRSFADSRAVEVAAELQRAYSGWLVIWSPWRRKFTAFGSCAADRLIVEDSSVQRLRALMDEAQWYSQASPEPLGALAAGIPLSQ